jgi:hypothetical protein
MTSYGPPGQPPGPPPPPGSYGPPASGGAAKFDPKSVNPLDWGILAAGVLSLIFSFFSYYTYDAKGPAKSTCDQLSSIQDQLPGGAGSALSDLCSGDSAGAWHGCFGWFGVLLALIGAGLVAMALFAPHIKLPVAARLAALGAFALAVISTLLALLVVPEWPTVGDLGGLISGDQYDKGVEEGHGFSYWIVLILIVVGLVLCFLRFQQTGGQLPGRTSATGAQSGYGAPPQQQQGYPQPGYQTPPAQPGYQPPAPQQPPYQPPQGPPPGQGYPPAPQPGYQPPPQPGYQPPQPGYQPPPQPPQGPPPQQYPPQQYPPQ